MLIARWSQEWRRTNATPIEVVGHSIVADGRRAFGAGTHSGPPWISARYVRLVAALLFGWLLTVASIETARADTKTCSGGVLFEQGLLKTGQPQPDLIVTSGECRAPPGEYFYGNVNIIGNGRLIFQEQGNGIKTEFWASSIVVESGGYLYAGAYNNDPPFGTYGKTLTIYLYGKDQSSGDPANKQGLGALCRSSENNFYGPCGIPKSLWDDNGRTYGKLYPVNDYFYQYGPLYGDKLCSDGSIWTDGKCKDPTARPGYFGYKSIGVSYGGGVFLRGYKGASYDADPSRILNHPKESVDADPLFSGSSWMRLAESLKGDGSEDSLTLERTPNWQPGDQIVVTTTDYLPAHSEQLTIDTVRGETITFHPKIQWPHNGERFALRDKLAAAQGRLDLDPDLVKNGAETRAAVALLTRSIRIVSAGDTAGETFEAASARTPCPNNDPKPTGCYYFGGHTVVRQGFAFFRLQGVEFSQLGQGGKLAHYPVHFHMARKTPADTYVKDSSVNESMTRWYVLHSTQGVTLARNVGYKSIGHGYYLEDGTETDNKFFSNLGVLARSATADDQNPRRVPGILAANEKTKDTLAPTRFPYTSDAVYPSGFWITNGWNDFRGNMIAGAGACGTAYWFVPSQNSDMPDVPNGMDGMHMKWTDKDGNLGYAGLQESNQNKGGTALKTFYKNYATSTMMSFQTTGDASVCHGFVGPYALIPLKQAPIVAVASMAPDPTEKEEDDTYYPHSRGGNRHATLCPAGANGNPNCSKIVACDPSAPANCAVTVLDHFTSSFHWAEGAVAAIWLRNQWYLFTNSVLSDVQNGGLTFVTGGDYTHPNVIPGYWALASRSVFIGHTQPQDKAHKFASDAGPFNPTSELKCDWQVKKLPPAAYCASKEQGISMPLAVAFSAGQRLFNIYDGPAYEDSVAYVDITTSFCPNTGASTDPACMYGSGVVVGVRKNLSAVKPEQLCFLPNAAIGWKQPNGFYYPPAFHSKNLYFNNVDIRHYVINPLFKAPDGVDGTFNFHQGGTYLTDTALTNDQYCTNTPDMFDNFSGIDRQTELSDDDGSLTGLTNDAELPTGTISVNQDPYFAAPVEAPECRSNLGIDPATACQKISIEKETQTARTSPYDYVTTAIAPECSQKSNGNAKYGRCGDSEKLGQGGIWSSECTNQRCYGVPLFRQYLTGDKDAQSMEWAHWFFNKCNDPAMRKAAQCRWPFMRMAGANMYQRQSLTVNHGTYYIDTTVSATTQKNEHFSNPSSDDYNVFEANKTYYMFFLYAKQTTEQWYQVYVGQKFNPETMLKAVRGSLQAAPVIFSDYKDSSGQLQKRPSWLVVDKPVDANGVLTVKINFTGLTELDPTPDNLCKPRSFCTVDNGECVTALKPDGSNSPLVQANKALWSQADKACKTWAVKDLDCPEKGCLGFAFTMPDGFGAVDQGLAARPDPTAFQDPAPSKPDWLTKFRLTATQPDSTGPGSDPASSCFYKDLPPSGCKSNH